MNQITIITDTDSSLPIEIAAQYQIRQVPIGIHFENESFITGVDIDDRLLFQKVDHLKKLPTTSAPAPSDFASAFASAFNEGAQTIICVCVSSLVSSTYSSAQTACQMFPGKDIVVIDSQNLSMGQGFMVLAAVEAVQNGATKEEVIRLLEDTSKRVHTYAVLPTLKYLALSGRVGKFVAGMADTFNIKPVLTVRDGKLDLLEKIRTWNKAVNRLFDLVQTACQGKEIERVAIIHVNNPDEAQKFKETICQTLNYTGPIIIAPFTPGLSVHAGTGVVGVVIMTR